MPADYNPYAFIAVLLGASVMFTLVPLMLARAWAIRMMPPRPGAVKNATYECGLESKGDTNIRFKSEYYLYGIMFLVFDVEAVFLFPFAVTFLQLPVGGFIAMLIFLLLLAEGLSWAWMKGVLTWK